MTGAELKEWTRQKKAMQAAMADMQEALRQVVFKTSGNFRTPNYTGPAYITREDASIKMAIAALAKAEGRE